MWSLPNIVRMNEEAVRNRSKLERAAKTGKLNGKKIPCYYAGNGKCEGELRTYLVYDIFSDDPKEVIGLCEHHDGYYGSPAEGYFTCDDCLRVMLENYTWELYSHVGEDGILCLPCYAKRELEEDENWISLNDAAIDALTFSDIRKAKHLIGVEMPVPKRIRFVNNVEFDSMDGHCISGGGLEEIKQTLHDLKSEGQARAILILDAAYQFAVSIGVYVPATEPQAARVA